MEEINESVDIYIFLNANIWYRRLIIMFKDYVNQTPEN